MLEKDGDERVVIERQDHHLESEALGNFGPVAPCVAGPEEVDGRAGHQCRSDERISTGFIVVTVNEGDSRPDATQCGARALGMSRKVRRMSSEFDRSPQ